MCPYIKGLTTKGLRGVVAKASKDHTHQTAKVDTKCAPSSGASAGQSTSSLLMLQVIGDVIILPTPRYPLLSALSKHVNQNRMR